MSWFRQNQAETYPLSPSGFKPLEVRKTSRAHPIFCFSCFLLQPVFQADHHETTAANTSIWYQVTNVKARKCLQKSDFQISCIPLQSVERFPSAFCSQQEAHGSWGVKSARSCSALLCSAPHLGWLLGDVALLPVVWGAPSCPTRGKQLCLWSPGT